MNPPATSIPTPAKPSSASFANSARKAAPSPSSPTTRRSPPSPRAASKSAMAKWQRKLIRSWRGFYQHEPLERHLNRIQRNLGSQVPFFADHARHYFGRVQPGGDVGA